VETPGNGKFAENPCKKCFHTLNVTMDELKSVFYLKFLSDYPLEMLAHSLV